jgi:hypothetical protein
MLLRRNRLLLITVLSFLLCFSLLSSARAAATMWTQTYGGLDIDVAYSLVATSDGGYALVGDSLFVKTDAYGNMEWSKNYGSFSSLVNASDGGYALAGLTYSFGDSNGYSDVWLVKTDEFGNIPEAPWVVLPFLLVATISIFISKKKLLRKHSEER